MENSENKDTYRVLKSSAEGLFKEKGSKFISLAYPVESEERIKEILIDIKKKYFDARHHCYAWVLGYNQERFRSNDDGEPSGSAGKPILNQIYSFGLTNSLVVVIRYFGGTKLGVSRLANAYKTASRDALETASIIERTIELTYFLQFPYELMNEVNRIMKEENLKQLKPNFGMDCSFEIACRKNQAKRIEEKFKEIFGLSILPIESL